MHCTHYYIMKKDLKKKNVLVVDKYDRVLSPTNILIANTLVARERAVWIEENKSLRLIKTKQDWKELKNRVVKEENRICYICNEFIPEDTPATVDHVNPKSKFGKDERSNLRCCCKRCNDDKANMNLDEYYEHVKSNIDKYGYIDLNSLNLIRRKYYEICTTSQSYGV